MCPPEDCAAFLHFGYLPRAVERYRTSSWAGLRTDDALSELEVAQDELIEPGLAAFRAAVDADRSGTLHVVPLSGGLDSRFLLGVLVDSGLRGDIVTATLGVPGTFDYEIAPVVARAAGVRHEAVDLSRLEVDHALLAEAVEAAPWSPTFEVLFNHELARRFGRSATYWSGHMANFIAGIATGRPTDTWDVARRAFADHARIARSTRLIPPGYRPESALPAAPLFEESCLTYFEQLWLCVREPLRNEPSIVPKGCDVRTPFARSEWAEFMLRAPRKYRKGQALYRAIVLRSNPRLFAIPTKNTLGLPLTAAAWRTGLRRFRLKAERVLKSWSPRMISRPNPKLNLDDLDHRLRCSERFRTTMSELLERLRGRGVVDWLDIARLEDRHARGKANHADALTQLASLELNLARQSGRSRSTLAATPAGECTPRPQPTDISVRDSA